MGHSCGFGAGALVTGRYGYKPIELIRQKDRVKTGPLCYAMVTETNKSENVSVVTLCVSGSENMVVVPDKRLFVRKRVCDEEGFVSFLTPEWAEAGALTNCYAVGYCLDNPMTSENRLTSQIAKKIVESTDENGYFPKGVFDISVQDQKLILSQLFWSASKVESRGRGTYVAVGVKSKFMAYLVARMARNCYRGAVDVERNGDKDGEQEFPYFVKVMINTEAAESFYEDSIVWQPVRGVIDAGQTADVYSFHIDSGNVCLINGLVCEA